MTPTSPSRAAAFLEQVLLANFLIHLLAMLSMGLLLLPGLPGGSAPDEPARIAYVADHPWLWRLGWLSWQLCALIDLLTSIALLRTPWVPRLPAWLTLLVTLPAVALDQTGEALWITRGVELAAAAQQTGDPTEYLRFEADAYRLIVAWGATLYLLMALGWTWCFASAGTWSPALTWLSALTWGALAVGSAGLLLPEAARPGPLLIAACNGLGFVLFLIWLAAVTEQVLRRARPDEPHGRLAPWRHPWNGLLGRGIDLLANSRFLRALGEWAPPVSFVSDITDVIYCNYLVEAGRLAPLMPAGTELQRLGPDGRYALLTFLTYKHGRFGPRLLGPLRRLMPSPVHSNWRIYVRARSSGKEGVYFFTNAIASTVHALAARLLSEGMPMHVPELAEVRAEAGGAFVVRLVSGSGSGPDVEAHLRPGPTELSGAWALCFGSYRDFLAYTVPQDRAISAQPWYGRLTRQEIQLGIPLETCEPLQGEVRSRAAASIAGEAVPLCFRVARVAFRFDREEHDPLVLA
jgi:hypothetical protein